MVLGRAPASQLAEKPALPLFLGGAAVYRCGNRLVLNSALAAEGTALDQELLFSQPVQPCRQDPPKMRALAPECVREN
jgi:hypothetical protein